MALTPSREAYITCALTGAGDTTGRSDKVPVTPAQIAEAGIEAARAGAAILHVHVRDPETGQPARRTSPPAATPSRQCATPPRLYIFTPPFYTAVDTEVLIVRDRHFGPAVSCACPWLPRVFRRGRNQTICPRAHPPCRNCS